MESDFVFFLSLFMVVLLPSAICQSINETVSNATIATVLVSNISSTVGALTPAPSVIAIMTTPASSVPRQTFTGHIPIHILPSNKIVDYFPWEVEIGLQTCPYTGMLVRARRGKFGVNSTDDEDLDDLRNYPSPHCSVECECTGVGDYMCRSICPPPPGDMDYCVPVPVPGECCHKYVCDDELDNAFPTLKYPEPISNRTTFMCLPGSILPDSVCHSFFPKAFFGHLGPKGVCFDCDDIRCAWLEDNEVTDNSFSSDSSKTNLFTELQGGRMATQTIFFQTAKNGTVFSTDIPLKKRRNRLRRP